MKFNLCGFEIDINVGLVNYNKLKKEIYKIEDKVDSEFAKKYYKKFANMDEVIAGIREFAYGYVYEAVEVGIQILNNNGVHTYNLSKFIDEFHFQITNGLDQMIELVEDEYLEIIEDQAAAAEYRQARKDARGRWQGGGFGIEGAVKGAVTAGAANMASGAAHSLVNAIGNAGSSIVASQKKKQMYDKESYNYVTYMSGISSAIEGVLDGVATVLENNTDMSVIIPKKDSASMDTYQSIIDNIKKNYITGHDAIMKECCNIIIDNPYYFDAYDQIMLLCADPNHEIEDMTLYFGITKIADFKKKRVREQLEKLDYFDIEKLRSGAESVYEWMDRFGVDKEPYAKDIELVCSKLSERAKEIDGVKYDSEESATKAKNVISDFLGKIAKTSANDVEAINTIIADLEASSIKSKDKYIKYLKDELTLEDKRFRTVKGKELSTRELADTARTEVRELDELLANVHTLADVEVAKEKVLAITTQEFKDLYMAYLAECEACIKAQDSSKYEEQVQACELRKDLAVQFYDADCVVKKANKLHCIDSDFKAWFDKLKSTYISVNGKVCTSSFEADSAYLKLIKHAKQYLEYITEKNAKKSLLGSIKNAATGLVYKNYEGEYNFVTQNGTVAIPNDQDADLAAIESTKNAAEKSYEEFANSIDSKYSSMSMSCDIETKAMSATSLYIITKDIEASDVVGVMSKSCKDFTLAGTGAKVSEKPSESEKASAKPDASTKSSNKTKAQPKTVILSDGTVTQMNNEIYKKITAERKENVAKGNVNSTMAVAYGMGSYDSDTCASCTLDEIGPNVDLVKRLIRIYTGKSESEVDAMLSKKKSITVMTDCRFDMVSDFIDDIEYAGGSASWDLGQGVPADDCSIILE